MLYSLMELEFGMQRHQRVRHGSKLGCAGLRRHMLLTRDLSPWGAISSNVVTGGPLDEPALRGGGATARMPDSDATPKSVTAVADSAASESGTPKPTDAATGQSENAPQTAAARLGGARGQESPGSRVDAESLVNRVENAIRAARSNGGALRIRLNPPELGSLQIEVSTRGGMFTARLEVQTSAARQAILENIAQLKDALAQSGTPLDKIEVHLAENESEEGRFGKNGDREQAEHDLEHGDPDRPSNSQADVDLQESPDDSEQDAINRPRSPRGLQQQLPMDQLDIQV